MTSLELLYLSLKYRRANSDALLFCPSISYQVYRNDRSLEFSMPFNVQLQCSPFPAIPSTVASTGKYQGSKNMNLTNAFLDSSSLI